MQILDCHIHKNPGNDNKETFFKSLEDSGISGGIILAQHPQCFDKPGEGLSPKQRLNDLFEWTDLKEDLYPFFWIDPMAADALDQVKMAVERGVYGFKIICSGYYIHEEKPLNVVKAIAKAQKPVLFHSGILWDGLDSSRYNRPSEFEALIEVDGLKFALAHVSWPWHDECIAVFGKFLAGKNGTDMFIDLTPGTPPIYRREVLTKLFTVGYNVDKRILFGLDGGTNAYSSKWAKDWINIDNEIYSELKLKEETIKNIYSENVKRFLGISKDLGEKICLTPGVSY